MPTTNPTLSAPASVAHGADGDVVVGFPDLSPAGSFTGVLVDPDGTTRGNVSVALDGEAFPEVVTGSSPVAGKWTLVASSLGGGDSLSATATPGVFRLHNG